MHPPPVVPWRTLLLTSVLAALTACGDPNAVAPTPDAGTEKPTEDAGHLPDAGQPPPGPDVTAQALTGAYLPSPIRAILPGSDGVLFGTMGVPVDPRAFGEPLLPDSYENWIRTGLLELNDTGSVRLWGSDDGLPTAIYQDIGGVYGEFTAPFYDLTWVTPDEVFVAAAWEKVIRGASDGKGGWTFEERQLQIPGQLTQANITSVLVAGGELFVGTNGGVAVMNPDTLDFKRWIDLGVSVAGPWVYRLATGKVAGTVVVAVLFGPAEANASHVAVLEPGQTQATPFGFADGAVPISLLGMDGSILVGAVDVNGAGVLYGLSNPGKGYTLNEVVIAGGLATKSTPNVIPGRLAWDAQRMRVVVGGQLSIAGGGGLIELPATAAGEITGAATEVIGDDDPYRAMLPLHYDVLTFDGQGRLYVSGRSLCSERRMRQLGVYRIERDSAGEPRLVRPFVSGVRSITVDPVNGDTWLSLRDELPGLACEGIAVSQGLCRLRGDGACELYPVQVNAGDSLITPAPGVAELAFGNPDSKEMALATLREATWVRRGDFLRVIDSQFDPMVSLEMTSATFGSDGALWLGSQMSWSTAGPGFDDQAINDRSPHGLGYLKLDAEGLPVESRRFVRRAPDQSTVEAIAGMPSNAVWDVLALGDGKVLTAHGIERKTWIYDHVFAEPSPEPTTGGIALVDGTDITVFAAPEGFAFGDVTALERRTDGSILALDSTGGVLEVDVANATVSLWAKAAWIGGERGLSLSADASGRVAVATDRNVYVYGPDGGVTRVFEDRAHGFVWKVRFVADGVLYAGVDQGLVQVALDGAALPERLGPSSFATRELWPLPVVCNGEEGCACTVDSDCAKSFLCACDPNNPKDCACTAADLCTVEPGAEGCVCEPGVTQCNKGLSCECSGTDCTCTPQSTEGCELDCTCPTLTGCPAGMTCLSGFGGFTCV